MKRLLALARWELRLQLRSVRCRAAVALYLAFAAVPPVAFFFLSPTYGPSTFLHHLLQVQPLLTVLLAVLVAGHRSGTAAWPEMWPVLASARAGNAGYLLGRWLAMVGLMVPVSAVPVAVAAGAAVAAGYELHDPAAWVGSWILRIVPLVFVTSALWLGLVTVLGGELAALAVAFVGINMALAVLNEILFFFRLTVDLSLTLDAFPDFMSWTSVLKKLTGIEYGYQPLIATESPFDARAVAEWLWPRLVVGAALSVFVLALAVAYVRRTRRDLKPRRVRPDHPLRSYLRFFLRWREHLTPSAALGRPDRLVMGCGAVLLTAGLTVNVERQRHYRQVMDDRHAATADDPIAPMSTDLKPATWKVRGEVEESGSLALEVRTVLRHGGEEPRDRLAFSLNEHLRVTALDVPGRRAAHERAWDRVLVTVEPPVAPGETVELRWRLDGTPAEIYFPLLAFSRDTFMTRVGRFRNARFVRELSDLSLSLTHRSVTPQRVALEASDLVPLPRYTPWALVSVDRGLGSHLEVPDEAVFPEAHVDVELEAADHVFLADACGSVSRTEDGRSRLTGGCRMPLAEYEVFGGPFAVTEESGLVFATLEAHRHMVREYGESLGRAARLSDRAWPGMEGFEGLVIVEWVPQFKRRESFRWAWGGFDLKGRLLLVREDSLAYGRLPMAERLIASLMTRDLIARRPVEPSQELFFREMYGALMTLRMGVSRQNDATVSGIATLEQVFKKPLLEAQEYDWTLWMNRMPAVLVDLRNRIGSAKLLDGIEKFLSRPTDEVGTLHELVAILERESGVPLARFHDDFFAGGALPKLQLTGVESRGEDRAYRVVGKLRNTGTGEVVCPVLVKTEISSVKLMVAVDSESETPFEARTRTRPHTVELDPEGTCHRLVTPARELAEHVDLLGRT